MALLDGKVAIVTGAARGIGREHALALARAGATVVVNDLGGSLHGEGTDGSPAEEVVREIEAAGGSALADRSDVADFAEAERLIQSTIETFGRLDILVNNAGILRDRMLVNMSEEEWDSVIRVHLKGHFAPMRHAAAYWRGKSKAGVEVKARIVNTSSLSGLFGNVGQSNYGAAKAGIAALTAIAAMELGAYGVTVNAIAPNARTRMTEAAFGDLSAGDGFDILDPANISPVLVALCADGAQHITGQCLFVSGGAVNILSPWKSGELVVRTGQWEPSELLGELLELFPDGLAPEGMLERMDEASAGQVGFG
ncbi:MAG TPA: SDR family oxidoreductase [Gaiellaceae bacterium]|jgi:NAD(P)-dependent dehydrogenase (short-subunit alcohol dehydrogenase family)|nr:SDR family oxidoreductase [Gaiellaceae bacterium]